MNLLIPIYPSLNISVQKHTGICERVTTIVFPLYFPSSSSSLSFFFLFFCSSLHYWNVILLMIAVFASGVLHILQVINVAGRMIEKHSHNEVRAYKHFMHTYVFCEKNQNKFFWLHILGFMKRWFSLSLFFRVS